MPLDPKLQKFYDQLGAAPPTVIDHGTPDEIRGNLTPSNPVNWRQEGNKLICDTNHGTLVNHLPTNYILIGTDGDGLPKFKIID